MVVEKKWWLIRRRRHRNPKAAKTASPDGEVISGVSFVNIRSLQYREPPVDVFASLIIGISVPLLQPTFELVALAGNGG